MFLRAAAHRLEVTSELFLTSTPKVQLRRGLVPGKGRNTIATKSWTTEGAATKQRMLPTPNKTHYAFNLARNQANFLAFLPPTVDCLTHSFLDIIAVL